MKTKKFYRKCDIIFWFVFMGLPIIVYLIRIVGLSFTHISEYSDLYTYVEYITNNNAIILAKTIEDFSLFNMNFLTNMFNDLGSNFISNTNACGVFAMLFGFMSSIVFYHLILDIILFMPKFFHNFLRRCDKYDE